MKRALITGITGQDGRHLSQFLSGKGYQVFGLVHGQANPKIEMVQGENPALELIEGDLRDLSSLIAVVEHNDHANGPRTRFGRRRNAVEGANSCHDVTSTVWDEGQHFRQEVVRAVVRMRADQYPHVRIAPQ